MALIERIADRFDLADGIIKSGACVHAPPGISFFFCAPLLPSIPGRRVAGAGAMAQLLLLFKTLKESYDLFDEVDPGNQEARPDLAPPPPRARARRHKRGAHPSRPASEWLTVHSPCSGGSHRGPTVWDSSVSVWGLCAHASTCVPGRFGW